MFDEIEETDETRREELLRRAKEKGAKWKEEYSDATGEYRSLGFSVEDFIERKASEYVDLEGDFEAMKDMSEVVAARWQKVVDSLPTLDELDCLIFMAEKRSETDPFFLHKSRDESLKDLRFLRAIVAKKRGVGEQNENSPE